MRIVALIPARAGSKRILGKNMVKVCGKPLILYTVEAAIKSGLKDIYVSTDDSNIIKLMQKYPVHIIHRPKKLATDKANMGGVVYHALEHIGECGALMLLQPTSPLRTEHDIKKAIDIFKKEKSDVLVSVCKLEKACLGFQHIDGTIFPIMDREFSKPSQTHPKIYYLNGAIYLFSKKVLGSELPWWSAFNKSSVYEMPPDRSADIDEPQDLNTVKAILETR